MKLKRGLGIFSLKVSCNEVELEVDHKIVPGIFGFQGATAYRAPPEAAFQVFFGVTADLGDLASAKGGVLSHLTV